ncbi:MAG: DNA repair protein [Clostridiales bacterium]|nr:DNA repair protein [Clostridiales bacterium]
MAAKQRTYLCIDMKCFYASVECAERGLNPFETNLVVADESRGKNALCLAISPKMKSLGVKNRCRLSDIPKNIHYIVAMPRMKKYIEYTADIYELYLHYIDAADIHVYSIDESFLDVTDYLSIFNKTPKDFAKMLINEIADKTRIPATCGIGTNLYLAKIALDITAKHVSDHIGYLDEETYRATLWAHRPITDFWQIAYGTAKRLAKYAIYDMQGVAKCPTDVLYKEFGINAELLIDHAWGRESCTIADIKSYKSKSKSISSSQILFSDYDIEKAAIVISEMTLSGCQRMMREHVVTNSISIYVGYSKDVIPPTGGTIKMTVTTHVFSVISDYVNTLFRRTTNPKVPIRRLGITFNNVMDEGCEGYDLFTDFEKVEREKHLEHAVLDIKDKFGKNSMLRAADLQEGATAIIRNKLVGGHNGE